MDSNTFDRITQRMAVRTTRRTATLGGVASLALLPGMHALAQDATPESGTPAATDDIEVLYVQTFSGGEITEAGDGSFALSLTGGTGQTVYFTDRPERLAGALSTDLFLDERAFEVGSPPNAALVTEVGDEQTVIVVELLDPDIDANSGTVTYRAQPVTGDLSEAMTSFQQMASDIPIGAIGPVSVFIDDLACASNGSYCNHNSQCCSGRCCADIETCPTFSCVG